MKICLYDSGIGVIPFLKVILKDKLYNDYYIYIDHQHFPYGEKSDSQLYNILKDNFKNLEKYNFDYIFICCNTMSRIYLMHKSDFTNKVRTILEVNLKDLKNYKLITTNNLSKALLSISGENLASYIENVDIIKIIKFIKQINTPICLGCTHYHLIKDLLPFYNVKFLSNEKKIFKNLQYSEQINIYVKLRDEEIIKKYIKIGLKLY